MIHILVCNIKDIMKNLIKSNYLFRMQITDNYKCTYFIFSNEYSIQNHGVITSLATKYEIINIFRNAFTIQNFED